jgi:RNA polymerase sigma-70 factor (ECF subfamily)
MSTTRATLLERVRDLRDAAAWEEFFALYAPLLEGYARAFGLPTADAEDVRDQCLALVVQRLETFHYDREKGSFKSWLHRIARDKVVDGLRRPRAQQPETQALLAVPDPGDGPDLAWEREWRAEHLRFAMAEVRRNEDEAHRGLFDLLLGEELSAAEIGARTGLNANQVYKARSRLVQEVRAVLLRLGEAP